MKFTFTKLQKFSKRKFHIPSHIPYFYPYSIPFTMLRCIPFLLLMNFCIALSGQEDAVLRTAETLRNNVVRLSVSFPGGGKQEGFGIITGEKNGQLYLATAAHVVHGSDFDQTPTQVQVRFYSELKSYLAEPVTFFETQDIGLLQMTKPLALEYQSSNWSDFAPQEHQPVRFIGRSQEWQISAQGEIIGLENERIKAYMPLVRPGTSGAPLINANGIVGVIIEDDSQEITAIALSKIRDLFAQGGRFPYFNSVAGNTTQPPVRNTPTENDLSTYNMQRIEGGKFRMGCIETRDGTCNTDEQPEHEVSISAFHLSKYEVTNSEFVQFLNAISPQISFDANADKISYGGKVIFDLFCDTVKGGCSGFKEQIEYSAADRPGGRFTVVAGFEKHPAVMVSKYGADAYCAWLSTKTGKTYRLPTEAEWEFAARGGTQSQRYKYAGANEPDGVAWYNSNSAAAGHQVGLKKANELGLYDLSGNVWEWCADWYDEAYYKNSPSTNPKGPASGTNSVLRGGSWDSGVIISRVANRDDFYPDNTSSNIGVRVARNL